MPSFSAAIRPHGGIPTLFVNDEPLFLSATYPKGEFPYPGGLATEHHTNSRLLCIRVAPQMQWDSDFAQTCEVIDRFLAWKPDGLIILRSVFQAPAHWLDAHPEEEIAFDQPWRHLPGYENYRDASIGSDLWREQMATHLRELCTRLHAKYDGRIIAYQFGGGSQGEFHPIGSCTHDSRWFCGDFSPAYLRYFRQWLRQRYGTDAALQKAWGRPEVTLDTAEIPDRVERLRSEWFTFRSPLRSQSADYYRSYSERVEETVIALCSVIKEATGRHALAGSHLGGFLDEGLHAYMLHQSVASSFRKAQDHPDVDLFTTPLSYAGRGPGGDGTPMVPLGSLQLHGKLRFQDQDSLTSIAFPPSQRTHENELLYFGYYAMPRDIEESVHLLQRDMAQMIIRGYGCWWHALKPGAYNDPTIAATISRFNEVAQESLDLPRGVDAGLCIVADDVSSFHQQMANRLLYPMLYYQRQQFWSRTGTGWELFTHHDLALPEMKTYPVYLFLNLFYLSDEEIAAIQQRLRGSGAVAIWTYAPGVQSPEGFDLSRSERLTGFRLRAESIEALPRVTVTHHDHPYTRTLGRGTAAHGSAYSFGTVSNLGNSTASTNDDREGIIGPVIYVEPDEETVVLGEIDCLRRPGFCVKTMPEGWTSVFIAAPMVTTEILRNILRDAGVHLYCESGDVVYPGKSHLMIHTRHAGEKTIRLPYRAHVEDGWTGERLASDVEEMTQTLPARSTAFYRLHRA